MPEPDYSKSVEQIYEHTTLAIVEETNSLEILIHSRPLRRRSLNLPSWVPDWSRNIGLEAGNVNHVWIEFESNDDQVEAGTVLFINPFATRHSKYRMPHYQTPGQLRLTGYRLGEISYTGLPLFPRSEVLTIQYREIFKNFLHYMQNVSPPPEQIDKKARQQVEWDEWMRLLLNRDPRSVYKGSFKGTDIRHAKRYKVFLGDQHPIRLSSGLHGIGESRTRNGDIVVLAHGADYPLVLRPYRKHFRFVGCVYIWGAMLGQLWPEWELSRESVMGTLTRSQVLYNWGDDAQSSSSQTWGLPSLFKMMEKLVPGSPVVGRMKLEDFILV